MMNSIVELFLNTMSEFTIQPSETEFTVLSLQVFVSKSCIFECFRTKFLKLQNIFNGYKSKANIQSKILIIVTSLLLTQDHDSELTSDVVEFLIKLLENPTESIVVQKLSLDSLIEIEVVYPVINSVTFWFRSSFNEIICVFKGNTRWESVFIKEFTAQQSSW